MLWQDNVLAVARTIKSTTDLTWGEIAEIINTDFDLNVTSEAIRKALARRNNEKPMVIPPAISQPLAPVLDIPYRDVLVLYDVHAGYHDVAYIEQAIRIAKAAKIKTMITDGDIFDFDTLSRYNKAARQIELNDELETAGTLLHEFSKAFEIFMIDANHSRRMKAKLNQPLDLQRVVSMALNGKSARVTATNREYMFMGPFCFAHPSEMNSTIVGKVPAQLAMKYDRHVLTGHTHKAGHMYVNGKLALEVGCCIDGTNVAYKQETVTAQKDFALGFAIIKNGECFHFDSKGNTTLNGPVQRTFSYWERYFKN